MGYGGGGAGNSARAGRAVSSIVGLVLLIGLVSLVSLGIFMVASESTTDVQQRAETERVESAFREFGQELQTASTANDVTRSVALDLDRSDGRVTRTDDGTIRVLVNGTERANESLGTLEYTSADGTRIVYQAGGIWRVTDGQAHPLTEPTVHHGDGTLTLPVAALTDDAGEVDGGSLSLSAVGSESLFSGTNDANVTISIESEFYEWWDAYFEEVAAKSSNVTVSTDPAAHTTNATFDAAEAEETTTEADVSLDPERAVTTQGQLVTASGGASETVGDVYAADGVEINHRIEGDVLTEGDVTLEGEGKVTGTIVAGGDVVYGDGTSAHDIVAGGDVEIRGRVDGDVYAYGDVTAHHGTLTGEVVANGSVDVPAWTCTGTCHTSEYVPAESVGPHPSDYTDDVAEREPIDDFYDEALSNADAKERGTLTQGEELTAGTYVVDAIDVHLGSLDFDVADGDVDVFVRGPVEMGEEGEFRVYDADSGNAARVFVDDAVTIRGTSGNGICAVPSETAECATLAPDQRDADAFQLYGTTDAEFSFKDQLEMHGIVYAPTGPGGPANAEVQAGGNLRFFGSFVAGGIEGTGEVTFERDDGMAYTPPAVGVDPSSGSATSADDLRFLHVTAYEVTLED